MEESSTDPQWGIADEAPVQSAREDFVEKSEGVPLLWWLEEDGGRALDLLPEAARMAYEYIGYMDLLVENGVPPEGVTPVDVTLDLRTGPLVIAGLQVLGLLEPRVRPAAAALIADISSRIPDATDEEQEVMRQANDAIDQQQSSNVVDFLRASGLIEVGPEEEPKPEVSHLN